MKGLLWTGSAILVLAGVWNALAQGQASRPGTVKPAPSANKTAPPAKATAGGAPASPEAPAAVSKRTAAEEAAAAALLGLAEHFGKHDSQGFAARFTATGEFIDESGHVYQGREAIATDFVDVFQANPEARIELQVQSTRVIAPGVIAVDARSRYTRNPTANPVDGDCHGICVAEGTKWLIASLREVEASDPLSHHDHVNELAWLIGDWIDEAADSHVHFQCRWDDGGNYLIRDFEVHLAGHKTITGTQRIGYDPLTGRLKSWVFDSNGGFAEGHFHRDGDSWILQAVGATADGRMASGSNVYTRLDDHRMTWSAVDRVIAGERIPDLEAVTVVRKPPLPTPRPQR
ncbi:MAG: SgcJ/EcaC family oxidoreductase [Planctomycetes bacterium]|nr:SgcJ/EcaC family oxidoreductase [Planctomycetota bacterium]